MCVYVLLDCAVVAVPCPGPWGNPDRWNDGSGKVNGNWERSIGLYRTSHTHLVQARGWLPDMQGGLVWYSKRSPSALFRTLDAQSFWHAIVLPPATCHLPRCLAGDGFVCFVRVWGKLNRCAGCGGTFFLR